ncbi:MAG: MFS transporter [Clostridium sp.]
MFKNKDIGYFTLYTITTCLIFETSIFAVFLYSRGIVYSHIAYLFSIYALSVFIFEYITGVVADRYSRKAVLIGASVSLIIGESIFLLGTNLYILALGMIFMAFSVASRSGADIAYIYGKIESGKSEITFDKYISNLNSLTFILTAVACVIGSFIAEFKLELPMIITAISYLISIMFLVKFKETNNSKNTKKRESIINNNIKLVFSNRRVLVLILIGIILMPGYHLFFTLLQPYLESNNVDIKYFGILYFVFTIFESIGAKLTPYINKNINSSNLILLIGFLVGLTYMVMFLKGIYFIIIPLIVMGLVYGVYYTINSIKINQLIKNEERASIISLQHALGKLVQFIILTASGLLISNTSLRFTLLTIGIFIILMVIILCLSFKSLNEYKEELEELV